MDILRAAQRHAAAGRLAVLSAGVASSYGQLLQSSESILSRVSKELPTRPDGSPNGPRIGVFAAPGHQYVAGTWATWMAGGIVVPLAVSHPPAELEYVLQDAGVSAVLVPEVLMDQVKDPAHKQGCKVHALENGLFPSASSSRTEVSAAATRQDTSSSNKGSQTCSGDGALLIYTSGTTGRPKGVLHTQGSLMAQVKCLVDAWRWVTDDRILHALPLHHTHGIINALHCAHYAGAAVDFMPKFSPAKAWERLKEGDTTVLMAVPTMYNYLLSSYDGMSPVDRASAAKAAAALRLAVSGSAACPIATMQRWQQLSGQVLLERYGMTETGMLLSNPYEGERRQGFVGLPLPGVDVRIAADAAAARGLPAAAEATANTPNTSPGASPTAQDASNSRDAAAEASSSDTQTSSQGELRVAGDMLFKEYWNRPDATAEAFDADGFFRTGDIVSLEGSPPYFRILGRASVDIIKSGGYKISGLDIENTLSRHPAVVEAAVLGVPDDNLGEAVAALVVTKVVEGGSLGDSQTQQEEELAAWCKAQLPPYQVPRIWRFVEELPRNAMGKVNKKQLKKDFSDL